MSTSVFSFGETKPQTKTEDFEKKIVRGTFYSLVFAYIHRAGMEARHSISSERTHFTWSLTMSRRLGGLAVVLSALAGTALGDDFSALSAPSGSERSHAQILSDALGGSFSASGLNFVSGSNSAIRNRDFGGVQSTDQLWKPGKYNARLVGNEDQGRVAEFGYLSRAHSNGRPFVSLFSTDTLGASATLDAAHQFRWAIKRTNGDVFTSLNSDQHGTDQLVSYTLFNELGKTIGSLLLFEDRLLSHNRDYNDVAVLLTLAPSPQAAGLGLLGLGGLGLMSGRRRR